MATIPQLIEFEYWANAQSLKAMDAAEMPIPEALSLLGHSIAIGKLWAARVEGRTQPFDAWPKMNSAHIKAELERLRGRWLTLAERHSPEDEVHYTGSGAQIYSNRFDEILQEILLHGAHHRGQVALILRLRGFAPPPSTDFIPALRLGAFFH